MAAGRHDPNPRRLGERRSESSIPSYSILNQAPLVETNSTSPQRPRDFSRPYEPQTSMSPTRDGRPSSASTASPAKPETRASHEHMNGGEELYGYAGPSWRGGAGARAEIGAGAPAGGGAPPRKPMERWWQALCGWGADLDGGVENPDGGQSGRTNPFE